MAGVRSATESTQQPQHEVLVIGSGFAGLCMAIQLKQDGEDNFVVLERGASVGGTWRDNDYPGAACDVPSHLYSFSFEPKADWSRKYPSQPELHAYLKGIAGKYGLLSQIRFNTTFTGAEFDEAAGFWRVRATQGRKSLSFTARSLVCGNGGLAEPKLPDIPGIGRFRGKTFHSSRWDHGYDLAGKVDRLDVYQRTPNWIIPRPDRPYGTLEKTLFQRFDLARRLHRGLIYWSHEARVMGLVLHPALMKVFQTLAERHIARQVTDPALRARVTPDYTIGCKRILISNDWYPALMRPNVDLVTDGIRELRENAVVTSDGQVREVDCIIFGTGFYATDNPIAGLIRGRDGQTLAQAWVQGEEAYLGSVVKGFPNLFLIVGPNTGLGHSSMVFMIETQVRYIRQLLAHLRQTGQLRLEVRPEVQDRYNHALQQRLGGSIWATGCKSWYQHRSGKITALWPDFTFKFWLRAREFQPADYVVEGAAV